MYIYYYSLFGWSPKRQRSVSPCMMRIDLVNCCNGHSIRDLQRKKSIGLPSYVEAYINFMGYLHPSNCRHLQTAVVTLTLLTVRWIRSCWDLNAWIQSIKNDVRYYKQLYIPTYMYVCIINLTLWSIFFTVLVSQVPYLIRQKKKRKKKVP